MSAILAPERPAPSAAPPRPIQTESALSPALQSYIRDCVRKRLEQDGCASAAGWFRIHLYLQLGDEASATALDLDLRSPAVGGYAGLIAIFGQLAPGLSCQEALARQMALLQGQDKDLHLLTPCTANRRTQVQHGEYHYSVLMLHEDANSLHCVMPCPMLVFSPVRPGESGDC